MNKPPWALSGWKEEKKEGGCLDQRNVGKKHNAILTVDKMIKEIGKEGGGEVTTLTNHWGLHGSFPGGEKLLKGCWEAGG